MQVRRFSPDLKVKIPGGHPGLYGTMIAMNRETLHARPNLEAFAAYVHGLPLELDAPVQVEAMYFEPQARLDEHSAPHPILFIVVEGSGMVRMGGPDGEAQRVTAGDAVVWPPEVDHTVWTEDERLSAIVINLMLETSGTDRESEV
jgi:quercetin dioxygenase-like cupin family protein